MNSQINYWTYKIRCKNSENLSTINICAPASDTTPVEPVIQDSFEPEVSEQVSVKPAKSRGARVLKSIFLGVPVGIPVFIVLMFAVSCAVTVSAGLFALFGALIFLCLACGILMFIYGFGEIQSGACIPLFCFASGFLLIGMSIFSFLISRVVFKYLIPRCSRLYRKPIALIKWFFT